MQALLETMAAGSVMASNMKGSLSSLNGNRGPRRVSPAPKASGFMPLLSRSRAVHQAAAGVGATGCCPILAKAGPVVGSFPCWLQPRDRLPPGLPALTPQQRNERTGRWGEELVFQYCQWQLGAFHATARPDTFRSANGWQVGRCLAEVQYLSCVLS